MKPNIKFLEKVREGKVMATFSYSPRTGGHYGFRGGEATAAKHAQAGYIRMPGGASLGRPAIATLTHAGIAALVAHQSRAAP